MDKFIKDPEAVLDYQVNWEAWLNETDTISASSWITDSEDLIIDFNSFANTSTTVWLSGGIDKTQYRVTNSIETVDGRKDDRSFIIKCLHL